VRIGGLGFWEEDSAGERAANGPES